MEGNLGQKGPSGKMPPSLRKEAELEEGEESNSSSLGHPKERDFPSPCGAPPLPLHLYILEDLHPLTIHVLEPPLVLLALVLVGPS